MTVKIKVDSCQEWAGLYRTLRQAGLLDDVTLQDVMLPESSFPVEIPIEVDGLVKLMTNPLVKPFKKRINENLSKKAKNVKAYIV